MIVNRRSETMRIGDHNVFEPGCRASASLPAPLTAQASRRPALATTTRSSPSRACQRRSASATGRASGPRAPSFPRPTLTRRRTTRATMRRPSACSRRCRIGPSSSAPTTGDEYGAARALVKRTRCASAYPMSGADAEQARQAHRISARDAAALLEAAPRRAPILIMASSSFVPCRRVYIIDRVASSAQAFIVKVVSGHQAKRSGRISRPRRIPS